ncbi:MAG TPA: hypothetical protein VMH22_02350 [bacterium]|nr:hypothetical protein [bacterium]
MSNDPIRQAENYEVSLRLGVNGQLSEDQIRTRVLSFSRAAAEQAGLVSAVRQILCSAGIVPMMFAYYYSFSRELAKLTRRETSTELQQIEMMSLVTKWSMRGLDRPVLLAIAADIYNIPAAAPDATRQDESGRHE